MENQLIVPAKRSIYHISAEHYELMHQIESNEGEITEEIAQALTINKEELETKAVSYGYAIKHFSDEVKLIDAEIERLEKIKSAKVKTNEGLKNRIKDAMIEFGITKVESGFLKLSTFASKQLVIAEGAKVPDIYINAKVTHTIDKTGLKKSIEQGEEIPGVWIQQNTNLKIS